MTYLKNNFKISLVLVLFFYVPIYLINKPFTDDYARNIRGYFGWSGDGRPLADIFIYIINFGSTLTDISPLGSILAVLICALTCAIISSKIIVSPRFSSIAASSSLVISPFFFHNALYHYDFLTMSLSMLFSVLPFLILEKRRLIGCFSTFLCLIVCLCLYQASYPIFFSCLFLMFVVRKNIEFNYFYQCVAAGLALIFYHVAIAPVFISGDYVVNHASPLPLSADGLSEAVKNIRGLLSYLHKLINTTWILVYSPAIILALAHLITLVKNRGITIKSTFYFLCLAFGMLISCLIFFLTKDPAYYPRVMIGFNSVVMLILCIASLSGWVNSAISTSAIILALLFNMSVITNLINYTKSIYTFESQTAQMMKSDMINLNINAPLVIHGYPPSTQIATRINERYPFAKDIIHPDLGWTTTRMFAEIEAPFFKAEKGSYKGKTDEVCGDTAKEWNGVYTITKSDASYHAVFRDEKCE